MAGGGTEGVGRVRARTSRCCERSTRGQRSTPFVSARRKLEALAKRFDYGCINNVPPFDEINPSAENIAEWFADQLGEAVAGEDAVVLAVTIWEGPVNSVTFRP